MSETIKRKEIIYMYESINSNANGDPNNDNRPRMDEETGYQQVSMYRIKRTIRDYLRLLYVLNNEEINQVLYRAEKNENGKLKELTELLIENNVEEDILEVLRRFIDVRLFGGLVGNKSKKISELQGPVQFSYGKSYHRVKEQEIGLSTVVPNSQDKGQGTLGTQFIVPYSLIGTDATINQFNAQKTLLTEEDIQLMLEGLWEGTNNLKTTSKNQKSLFMVLIEYKDNSLKYIGELKKYFKLESRLDDLEIRGTEDFYIETVKFINKINNMSENIDKIYIKRDSSLNLLFEKNEFSWSDVLKVDFEEEIL